MDHGNMKEQYYTDASIDQQAQAFLKEIIPLRTHHNIQINPAKAALLVIDMQNYFVDKTSHAYIPSVDAIIPRVVELQNYCLQNGIKIIQTRHAETKENAGMMAKWWGGWLLESTNPASEVITEIAKPEIMQITKSQYDAFYEPACDSNLDFILKTNGIEQVIITGVMTHLCCETTARAAFTRGYEVFFSIDGTATYNRQFHLGSLINLAHGFAVPMLVDEIITQLRNNE
jgi:bifunctional isochorismate lyase / aryl carrier protein